MPYRIPIIHTPSDLPNHLSITNGAPSLDDIFAISTKIDATWVKTAYTRGLFPWYSSGQPVLWHSPEPRMVLQVDNFKYSSSLKKRLKQWARQSHLNMRVTINHAFTSVINNCAIVARQGQSGTWITDEIKTAYSDLHEQHHAISVELWQSEELKAGLYGVIIGQMFFGESMFTHITDGSKAVLACWIEYLRQNNCELIDCQQNTTHLFSLGGAPISRAEFFMRTAELMQKPSLDFKSMYSQANLLGFYV